MKFRFPDIHITSERDGIRMQADVDFDRFERSFSKSQFQLDSMVMTDMVPYMPMITGTFINLTKARSAAIAGTGYVYAAAPPYGRFLYYGKVMVSPTTGSAFARAGERKVVTSRDLEYTKTFHPLVHAEWFEEAKRRNKAKWIKLAKRKAGG